MDKLPIYDSERPHRDQIWRMTSYLKHNDFGGRLLGAGEMPLPALLYTSDKPGKIIGTAMKRTLESCNAPVGPFSNHRKGVLNMTSGIATQYKM